MPRVKEKEYTSNGKTPWVPLDRFSPYKSFLVKDPSGSATFTLEHLLENPQLPDFDGNTTVKWITDDNIADSTSEDSAIGFVTSFAVRLNLTGVTGPVTFTIIQGQT